MAAFVGLHEAHTATSLLFAADDRYAESVARGLHSALNVCGSCRGRRSVLRLDAYRSPVGEAEAGLNAEQLQQLGASMVFYRTPAKHTLHRHIIHRRHVAATGHAEPCSISHLRSEYRLTLKHHLATSLRDYERSLTPDQLRCWHDAGVRLPVAPRTWTLSSAADCRELYRLPDDGTAIYIVKPVGRARGEGISLLRGLSEFRAQVDREKSQHKSSSFSQSSTRQSKPSKSSAPLYRCKKILQDYIHRPLLVDGRKFDIRVYLLVVQGRPPLVFYHHGYCRLLASTYDVHCSRLDDLFAHITNTSLQVGHPDFSDASTRWTFEQLAAHFDGCDQAAVADWLRTQLQPAMQRTLAFASAALLQHSASTDIDPCFPQFMLVGADFIVDQDLRLWLLEFSGSPNFTAPAGSPLLALYHDMIAAACTIVHLYTHDNATHFPPSLWQPITLPSFVLST